LTSDPTRRRLHRIAALAGLLAVACASPSERFAREAEGFGFASAVLQGDGFRHLVYAAGRARRGEPRHVYIEHDGTPWLDRAYVASDPTPRSPFALELMARDAGPRLLLGRPCYFETRIDAGCSPRMWTHRRYSGEVVASMVAALRGFLAAHPFPRIVLIGYSGGGTLAWLIARDVPQTTDVVTVAANLDTDYWTTLHAYTPMTGSLNPGREAPLPDAIRQVHYVGQSDHNVPPSVARAFQARHPGAGVIEIPDFDHRCCWIERWPQLLDRALLRHD
jgi:dienelactone hydrolase